jgi:hypothetical protein
MTCVRESAADARPPRAPASYADPIKPGPRCRCTRSAHRSPRPSHPQIFRASALAVPSRGIGPHPKQLPALFAEMRVFLSTDIPRPHLLGRTPDTCAASSPSASPAQTQHARARRAHRASAHRKANAQVAGASLQPMGPPVLQSMGPGEQLSTTARGARHRTVFDSGHRRA